MSHFCGFEHCKIDANGRIKLPSEMLKEFLIRESNGGVVFRCLPEGALALYPKTEYDRMLAQLQEEERNPLRSLAKRRELRYEGTWSCNGKISPQGRITLPNEFRKFAALELGEECIVTGSSAGVEFWNPERWQKELQEMQLFHLQEGEREMRGERS